MNKFASAALGMESGFIQELQSAGIKIEKEAFVKRANLVVLEQAKLGYSKWNKCTELQKKAYIIETYSLLKNAGCLDEELTVSLDFVKKAAGEGLNFNLPQQENLSPEAQTAQNQSPGINPNMQLGQQHAEPMNTQQAQQDFQKGQPGIWDTIKQVAGNPENRGLMGGIGGGIGGLLLSSMLGGGNNPLMMMLLPALLGYGGYKLFGHHDQPGEGNTPDNPEHQVSQMAPEYQQEVKDQISQGVDPQTAINNVKTEGNKSPVDQSVQKAINTSPGPEPKPEGLIPKAEAGISGLNQGIEHSIGAPLSQQLFGGNPGQDQNNAATDELEKQELTRSLYGENPTPETIAAIDQRRATDPHFAKGVADTWNSIQAQGKNLTNNKTDVLSDMYGHPGESSAGGFNLNGQRNRVFNTPSLLETFKKNPVAQPSSVAPPSVANQAPPTFDFAKPNDATMQPMSFKPVGFGTPPPITPMNIPGGNKTPMTNTATNPYQPHNDFKSLYHRIMGGGGSNIFDKKLPGGEPNTNIPGTT